MHTIHLNEGINAYNKKDFVKAAELYAKACDGGDASGCFNLGIMYADGEDVRANKQTALDLFDKACDLKDQHGCEMYSKLKKEMGL